ncbi:hypothetical protein MKK50_08805 [Methylobacterium sp. J-043]|uniref:hypothetical protein n=1 Tax=Methylorubrum TaxID=2282523 RepID=UPI0020A1F7BF|nr:MULTISPECIES: hypothetical protein [Methylorubrum]MCJ2029498.1 hypothetical protein [Methylobacterium sp. J-043]MCP1551459.1 hypothetical protein [Methylorubrum zatmanii]MCP1556396.1 hypothetical protein [Methylorubrum extorquens]MCP1581943.1 hypothetical protein [Methylorubrum extorquens]
MIRAALLSATLFLAAIGSVQAQKLTLPVGVWGHDGPKGPDCKKPFLKIEEKRILHRFDEGEGRCTIKTARKKSNIISLKTKCDWDASVPPELQEGPDEADGDSFSLKIVSNTKILFNNTEFGFCSAAEGSAQ